MKILHQNIRSFYQLPTHFIKSVEPNENNQNGIE